MTTALDRVDVRRNDEDGATVMLIDGQEVGPEMDELDMVPVYHWLTEGGLDAIESRDSEPKVCGVCVGTGRSLSRKPCICKGAGTQLAELQGLREAVFEQKAEVDRLREQLRQAESLMTESERTAFAEWRASQPEVAD